MISFKKLNSRNADTIYESLSKDLDVCECSALSELIYGIDTEEEDVEYAVSVYESCLIVRIFDMGRYLFVYPCELSERADVAAALEAVSEYAMREEVPLVFVDTPGYALSEFAGYRHMDVDADDYDSTVYIVRIKTECELVSEIPEVKQGRVELSALSEGDIPFYAELCRDKNVNKYWGYDYSEDIKNPTDEYFYESANADFARGVAMTMAVRAMGKFVGEATIYAFDGKGGAEFAVRLLSEYQGRGLGTEAALAAMEAARKIGLVRLYAKIMKENSSSIAMFNKIADDFTEDEKHVFFTVEL